MNLYPEIKKIIAGAAVIPEERISCLQDLADCILEKLARKEPIRLNFICTHNSRRSQFAQLWAKVASEYFGIELQCGSGGVEVTAFNERAVESAKRMGFQISSNGDMNPHYLVKFSEEAEALEMYSKLYSDVFKSTEDFVAVMTCAHADENCPVILGAGQRIPLRYEDPKAFDGTGHEAEKYDERSRQIAAEMFYVFREVSRLLGTGKRAQLEE